jgi:3-hydroxyisobutyrate dehydrogenase
MMPNTKTSLGFIGIGLMGAPLTRRLLNAGYRVTIWNRSRPKCEPLAAEGARIAECPAEVVSASHIVLMCVTDTKAVTEIVTKTNGIRDGAAAGKILIDHSSIEPDATRRLATQLRAEKGMHWIDAPVSGGIAGAEAGKLVVMAGGEDADIEKVRPIIANYALRLTHMGPVGAGQVTKLCNQVIVGATIAIVAEALMLAANGGVDPARLPECLAGGYADSPILQNHGRRMASGDLTPLGGTGTMQKDMDTAVAQGRNTGTALPMASLTAELYRMLSSQGHGPLDQAGLIRLYAKGPLQSKRG